MYINGFVPVSGYKWVDIVHVVSEKATETYLCLHHQHTLVTDVFQGRSNVNLFGTYKQMTWFNGLFCYHMLIVLDPSIIIFSQLKKQVVVWV